MDASVEFLLNNLKQLVIHQVQLFQGAQSELEGLEVDLRKLKAFLVDAVKYERGEALKEREREVRELVYDIEDIIDTSITHFSAQKANKGRQFLSLFKSKPIKLAEAVRGIRRDKVQPLLDKLDNVTFPPADEADTTVTVARQIRQDKTPNIVGFDKEAEEFITFFNNESEKLEIGSIVGMAGLGKTTLAWKIFEDSNIKHEFPVRIWVNVSEDLNMKKVLLTILRNFTADLQDEPVDDLLKKTRELLMAGNFFIVMDDIWTLEAWRQVEKIFPTNCKMGRVLVTTRFTNVAIKATTRKEPHYLRFLTNKESWELLQYVVFGNINVDESKELVSIGQIIAADCDGLPLSIVVIGGILVEKTTANKFSLRTKWEEVSRSVKPYLVGGDKNNVLSSIISLSYQKLAYEFKNCFLYLGVFPEDADIPVNELIRLWIAEGFIQESDDKSMEQVALDNLNELINRNLVMVKEAKLGGEAKICQIHDSVRGICKAEAKYDSQNFFQEIKRSKEGFEPHENIEKCRRLSIHSNVLEFFKRKQKIPKARSFLCFHQSPINLKPADMAFVTDGFGLLRVYNAKQINFPRFPNKITQLLHLRYLTLVLNHCTSLPEMIDELWNLQTLIVDTSSSILNIEANIWKMKQLRHLKSKASIILRNDMRGVDGGEKLQTLSKLSPDSCTPGIFNKAKNLVTLGIQGDLNKIADCKCLRTLVHLNKLKLVNEGTAGSAAENPMERLPSYQDFPSQVKTLILTSTYLDWNKMDVLSRLGCLEVLKLKDNAFKGSSWNAAGGGFYKLQQLNIDRAPDLVSWTATRDPFPTLRFLLLSGCDKLVEVPAALYDTLEMLYMERVSKGAVSSAETIWMGKNKSFKLDIAPTDKIRT